MTTSKNLTGQTPFRLVYGQEEVMSMEFIVPSLCVAMITDLSEFWWSRGEISKLVHIEEYCFVIGFHQQVHKVREKAWHDRHIKQKKFQVGDLVLLYNNKFMQHPGNFECIG
jgi:hypothetical protein